MGNNNTNTANSPLISTEAVTVNPDHTVVYPDYSTTDVGEGKNVWPNQVFAPFVNATSWPTYSITLANNEIGIPYFMLGFIVSRSSQICEPTWGSYYDAQSGPMNDQIKIIRERGGDICISFGGVSNNPLYNTATDVEVLYEQYKRFCDGYKLTMINFDIEGNWITPIYEAANQMNSEAIKKLQDYYKENNKTINVWFTLPVLPTGLTSDGIRILQQAIDAGVEIGGVNIMTMDYGDTAAPNPSGKMGYYGLVAITAVKNQLRSLYKRSITDEQAWQMIGTMPMLGINDVKSEIFDLSDAKQTLAFAKANNVKLICMWSSNRDTTGTSATGINQSPNDFGRVFQSFNLQ